MNTSVRFRFTGMQWLAAAVGVAALAVIFTGTFTFLYAQWQREEYSHGFVIPLIVAFLIWQRHEQLACARFRASWAGVAVVALGMGVFFVGSLASITTVDAYALVIVIIGCALAVMGWRAFRLVLVPLLLLFLMNPIPNFFYNSLSLQLQLLSSRIGVAFIRLFGISVFLEGNVIDLGTYQLQVAEACSGLRYLFPLMTLGVIVGYLFRSRMWMRWCVFLSTVPITILMNSFRIGVIGILVDRFGIAQAEGFLHLFEGWVVFMACFLLLFAECKLLLLLSGDRRHLRELLAIELPRIRAAGGVATPRVLGAPALVALALLLAAVYPARALPQRVELRPAREDFSGFPLRLADWQGRRQTLEQIYLDTLQLDDYLLANYFEASAQGGAGAAPSMVNVYVAYYASQRTGQSAHSPRSCLPGGGWGISDFGQRDVPGVTEHGVPLRVNRAVIQHGANRQLVYYWFQERGRDITNEYLVKWHLVTDAILRNRTDGALVRLVTPLPPDEDIAAADARLAQFSAALRPVLGRYLPD